MCRFFLVTLRTIKPHKNEKRRGASAKKKFTGPLPFHLFCYWWISRPKERLANSIREKRGPPCRSKAAAARGAARECIATATTATTSAGTPVAHLRPLLPLLRVRRRRRHVLKVISLWIELLFLVVRYLDPVRPDFFLCKNLKVPFGYFW